MKLIDVAALYFPDSLIKIDANLFIPQSVAALWPHLLANLHSSPINCGWGLFKEDQFWLPAAICSIDYADSCPSVYIEVDAEYAATELRDAYRGFWLYHMDDKHTITTLRADPAAKLSTNRQYFLWRSDADLP
jgi:hypothetical protein